MHPAKYLALRCLAAPVVRGSSKLGEQSPQFVVLLSRLFLEGGDRVLPARDEAIAPSLGFGETALHVNVAGAETGEFFPDRAGVDVAHEFADPLPLAAQCRARPDSCSGAYRLEQPRIQVEGGELVFTECDEFLAERLQGELFALAGGFAGL